MNDKTTSGDHPTEKKLDPALKRLWNPINNFINKSTSSGIVLLLSTLIALVWANLNAESYHNFWHIHAQLGIGNRVLSMSLVEWVNDGLMTIFFLSVGLEIKREMQVGDLSSFGQAILPVTAAAGGMLMPALFYTLCAHGSPYAHGWGIPVATDIAFALGIITMLGNRVPSSLKIFLAALAIADDLGAVLIIAFFYSANLNFTMLFLALLVLLLLFMCNRMGVNYLGAYIFGGFILWIFVMKSGVHATLAGVMLAFVIPTWTVIDKKHLRQTMKRVDAVLAETSEQENQLLADRKALDSISLLGVQTFKALPRLTVIEEYIATSVNMVIMPIFALANSGVVVGDINLIDFLHSSLSHGIALGLICGKPIGITLGTLLTIKSGLASLPRRATWSQIFGVGMLGGIGFTMSLFVTGLSISKGAHEEVAKLAILCSSTTAGILGFIWLYLHPQKLNKKGSSKTSIGEQKDQLPKEKAEQPPVQPTAT
ncbi:Na+/H+ antiporter NhaA [bacterium]|nr:Na+/H+ antiporter NhaA [bacterium]